MCGVLLPDSATARVKWAIRSQRFTSALLYKLRLEENTPALYSSKEQSSAGVKTLLVSSVAKTQLMSDEAHFLWVHFFWLSPWARTDTPSR